MLKILVLEMGRIMKKPDIISKMAEEADITKAVADKALTAFQDAVKEGLKNGKKVSLIGFGSFSVSERNARKGRNPQPGEEIEIPASKTAKFTPAKGLKEEVSV